VNSLANNFLLYSRQTMSGLRYITSIRLSVIRKVFSLMGKREKVALSLLSAVAVVNLFFSLRTVYHAITVPDPDFGGSYTEGMLGQPQFINPLLASQETDIALTRLVYSGLYRYGGNGQLIPDLAEETPKISEDQKQYTIKLRKDAKWHNELPFTADDVVFTFEALKNEEYNSPWRELWLSTTVEKISDHEITFTTKDVSGPFINNLTQPILPKSVWDNLDAQDISQSAKNLEAVGTGPYEIKEIKRLTKTGKVQQLTLAANREYHLETPHIETLVLKFYDSEQDAVNALHSREIEGLGLEHLQADPHLGQNMPQMNVYDLPLPQYQVIFFNTQHPVLSDKNIRIALSRATNKQAVVDKIFEGDALLPSWPLTAASSETDGFNLEEARTKLDALDWKTDAASGMRMKKGVKLELTLSTNDDNYNSKTAEEIAYQWRQLGITVHLNILPTRQLMENHVKTREFDILLFPEKFGPDPDPFVFWHSSQARDPGLNLTGFRNSAVDKIITEARTTTDQKTRKQKYEEFYQIIKDEAPAIFLTQTRYTYAVHSKAKNAEIHLLYDPAYRFYSIPDWYIVEGRKLKNWF
jgi:peptide/nickel transport system substrate-binding protein